MAKRGMEDSFLLTMLGLGGLLCQFLIGFGLIDFGWNALTQNWVAVDARIQNLREIFWVLLPIFLVAVGTTVWEIKDWLERRDLASRIKRDDD